jgi:hypothetical protein
MAGEVLDLAWRKQETTCKIRIMKSEIRKKKCRIMNVERRINNNRKPITVVYGPSTKI